MSDQAAHVTFLSLSFLSYNCDKDILGGCYGNEMSRNTSSPQRGTGTLHSIAEFQQMILSLSSLFISVPVMAPHTK